jgi:hypothetical protein
MPKLDQFSRYARATSAVKQRIIGASFGEPGMLKTSFWLGAPPPILIQSLDQGLEGVIEETAGAGKAIYVAEYDWHPTDDKSEAELKLDAQAIRDKFIEDFEHGLGVARTIVWDKETDVWELFRYAEFGTPNDQPRDYPKLYQRYRRYVNMPKTTDINFGLIQGMKSPWTANTSGTKGLAKSVERVRKGMDEIEALVHVNVEHYRADHEFRMRVGKVRGPGARAIQYQEYPFMEFVEFAQMVFPESAESEWL